MFGAWATATDIDSVASNPPKPLVAMPPTLRQFIFSSPSVVIKILPLPSKLNLQGHAIGSRCTDRREVARRQAPGPRSKPQRPRHRRRGRPLKAVVVVDRAILEIVDVALHLILVVSAAVLQ